MSESIVLELDVFGRRVLVLRRHDQWVVFYLGNEGKRRPANDLVIPADFLEREIPQYLADICHEWAMPQHPDVRVLSARSDNANAGATPDVNVLLFDLGGVLMDYVGVEALHALTNSRYSLEEVREHWPDSPALTALETGKCSPDEFAHRFVSEWRLPIEADEFLRQFSDWLRAPYHGALELLQALKGRYVLACLSNINAVYWEHQVAETGFETVFDRCYASHEIGCLKPDPRAYRHVISDLGYKAESIVFFDDTQRNVEAAVSVGMRAYRVQALSGLKTTLGRLALL